MRWRFWCAWVVCGLILLGAWHPFYFRMLTPDRNAFGRFATNLPYQKTPGLRQFMLAVRDRTHEGERIAIAVPMLQWDGGYAYAFTRSTYLLAGRTTVPLVDKNDRATTDNLARADVIAAWHTEPEVPGFSPVWRSGDGILLRRIR
jgi:hypothetical protein